MKIGQLVCLLDGLYEALLKALHFINYFAIDD